MLTLGRGTRSPPITTQHHHVLAHGCRVVRAGRRHGAGQRLPVHQRLAAVAVAAHAPGARANASASPAHRTWPLHTCCGGVSRRRYVRRRLRLRRCVVPSRYRRSYLLLRRHDTGGVGVPGPRGLHMVLAMPVAMCSGPVSANTRRTTSSSGSGSGSGGSSGRSGQVLVVVRRRCSGAGHGRRLRHLDELGALRGTAPGATTGVHGL